MGSEGVGQSVKRKLGEMTDGGITLPCGYVDPQGVVHDTVEIVEMSGDEEDILAAPKKSFSEKLSKILANTIKRIGTITDKEQIAEITPKLTIGDRAVLLLALRCASLDKDYSYSIKCPSCDVPSNQTIDLYGLDVVSMADKKVREVVLVLPSGKKATVRVMSGEDEAKLGKIGRNENTLSLAILARLRALDDNKKPDLKTVKSLSYKDRLSIRDWYQTVEGGVDTEIEMSCPACHHEFGTTLDVGQTDFLFPKVDAAKSQSPAL